VVIVDEVHAFAGDDRGWHLLAVLDRIARLSGAHQRIGLSATVGNPDTLVEWLAGNCDGQRTVFQPPPGTADAADVTLDYVGSLQNAAHVISRLHRGEKRLVFVDSRSRAEQLGKQLAELDVTTFVTHSSLSQEQRHQAEEAFASRDNCVIVSTSALELGIDVGDLDRVIQIDSPPSVSSFLQRMGRTGRRSDTTRNCLFLATKEEALIQAAGLIDLWAEGYVEPIVPPLSPLHIAAQQVMALALQQQGIARDQIHDWIAGFSRTAELSREQLDELVDWMLAQAILSEDNGLVWLGHEGESAFGRRNFSALFSVFTSPPLFTVLHGRRELGFVDQLSFLGQHRGPRVLLLGGRSWRVTHIDWGRRHAFVEATDERGSTRWSGQGQGLSYRLCQSIKAVVGSQTTRDDWSQRACDQISETRDSFWWVDPATTTVISSGSKGPEWWTFGGNLVNSPLAATLERESGQSVQVSNLAITIESGLESSELRAAIERTLATDIDEFVTPINDEAIEGLKFSECLPTEQATELLQRRLIDRPALSHIIEMNVAYAAPEAR
jgi:ATP-dependent Lhr-like helicase